MSCFVCAVPAQTVDSTLLDIIDPPFASGGEPCEFRGEPYARVAGRLLPTTDSLVLVGEMLLEREADDGRRSNAPDPANRTGGEAGAGSGVLPVAPERCIIETGRDGSFSAEGIPRGRFKLSMIADFALQRFPAISFAVESDTVVRFHIPVFPGNAANFVEECVHNPRCSSVLTRVGQAEANAPDQRRLTLLGYRLTIAHAVDGIWRTRLDDVVACVEASEADRDALLETYALVVDASECQLVTLSERTGGRAMRHTQTGRAAAQIGAPRIERLSEDSARIVTSWFEGGFHGQQNRCEMRRIGNDWLVTSCRNARLN